MAASRDAEIHKDVQNYYGNVLRTSADLQTNACVTPAKLVPKYIRERLQNVHEAVTSRYYGCGLVVPERLESCRILDLGSGSGRDCYVLSQLVGEKGHVTGIDMTEVQHGGELYFSDVYASLEVPEDIKSHKVLWGECLGGALYWKDLAIIAQKIGFCPPRLVTASIITVENKELERVLGDCRFVSATFRLFKIPKTEPAERCHVVYNGGITGHEKELIFDANFTFKEGEAVEVDEETAAVLKNSRFAHDFLFLPVKALMPAPQGCSELETKVIIKDPFKLAEESDKMKPRHAPEGAGGCCGKRKSC
ncbi:arsenite methyltransferase isoform X2 [Mastomys coucha]|uniref:arsenite methyltransferase isoform X2 n=1 Tax=Mastomys coucha TaxID=35658 RepID=UPI001261C812|nr:arsenite methyltransferase isoform X2 [Mastomys coucha]